MDNQKDQKILAHIEAGQKMIAEALHLKPDEKEVLEALSHWHVLTEEMVTEMYNQSERERNEKETTNNRG